MQLVADANVLLAAILGGKARLILASEALTQTFTSETTFAEVEEYALILGRNKHLSSEFLLLALSSLPITIVQRNEYAGSLSEARRRVGRRDPDDVDILALALHLQLPLWSNDRDFEGTGIEVLTTEYLLRKFRLI